MKIRASMLPGYADCARRASASQWRKMVNDAGFRLRRTLPTVGATVGTAVHKGAAILLKSAGTLKVDDALSEVVTAFREEIREGVTWDDTTPETRTAEQQIIRMLRVYAHAMATEQVTRIESEFEGDLGNGRILSGHPDLVTVTNTIRDIKTGKVSRPHHAQLGAYAILVENQEIPVAGLAVDFLKRVPLNKPQPEIVSKSYAVRSSMRIAWALINQIIRDMDLFIKTGDSACFTANPMSMMCNEKFCPAFGTKWCEL
ncbi:MAG: PD-(D/E)XK nuclease family protein [Magnetococcus sp. DMHC-1]